ncbi:MAG: peptidoglycan editing factor PgeF [Candidatus Neomarinimicrobiota bacterium]
MFVSSFNKNIEILQSDLLAPFSSVVHGFSTRTGGVSPIPFDSLNLGLNSGDLSGNIETNRRLFCSALDFPMAYLAHANQIHSGNVAVIDRAGSVPDTDALTTNMPDIFLNVKTADCVPILLFEPKQKVVAAVHAGWKGIINNVIENTIETMIARFHCKPSRILVAIGPSIRSCCYEVQSGVAGQFSESEIVRQNGRLFLDATKAVHTGLENAGILPKNIDDCGCCTMCEPKRFYSYRRDGVRSGRMMAVIGMRE